MLYEFPLNEDDPEIKIVFTLTTTTEDKMKLLAKFNHIDHNLVLQEYLDAF